MQSKRNEFHLDTLFQHSWGLCAVLSNLTLKPPGTYISHAHIFFLSYIHNHSKQAPLPSSIYLVPLSFSFSIGTYPEAIQTDRQNK